MTTQRSLRSQHSNLRRCSRVLEPYPSAVYASPMGMMLPYPTNSTAWSGLHVQWTSVSSCFYHLSGYTVETVSDKDGEEDEDRRIDAAVETIQGWGMGREWAEGEGWWTCLSCFVRGGVMDFPQNVELSRDGSISTVSSRLNRAPRSKWPPKRD